MLFLPFGKFSHCSVVFLHVTGMRRFFCVSGPSSQPFLHAFSRYLLVRDAHAHIYPLFQMFFSLKRFVYGVWNLFSWSTVCLPFSEVFAHAHIFTEFFILTCRLTEVNERTGGGPAQELGACAPRACILDDQPRGRHCCQIQPLA